MFLLTAMLFSGCGQEESSDVTASEEAEAAKNASYITVGYAQIGSESDWRIANTESFKSTFTETNGYYLIYEDGQQKQENQLKAVRNFILQEVDYIILDPIVESGWDGVLEEAREAGIPVILTDRFVEIENPDLYLCWVGSDFEAEGRNAGLWLQEYLESQGREDEQIHLVTLQGTPGSTAQLGRTSGFDEILRQQENWVMLEQQSADFTQSKGQEVMTELLKTYPDIDVVISENDNMTFGAIQALREAGKTFGPDGDIILISFDATKTALEAVRDGLIHVDFECNPLLGPAVAEIIQKLEAGKTVEKNQYVEETWFDNTMDLDAILETRAY